MTRLFRHARIPAGGNDTRPADFLVEGGRFLRFLEPGRGAAPAEGSIDLAGALVLPGVIDGHVHFFDPGYPWRETFATGTRAAAAGGVTCVADMPCTSLPPVTSAASLHVKREAVAASAHVDYIAWGGICANVMEEDPAWREGLAGLAGAGAGAVKCYLLSGMEGFRALSPSQLRDAALCCRDLGLPLGVHAEDRDFVTQREAAARAAGEDGWETWWRTRSQEAESLAVATVARTARATGARMHVVHVGAGAALDLVEAAARDGARLSAETCPHYLAFTREDFARLGSVLKTVPPVKEAADRDRLWRALAEGALSFVATDHAGGEWPREKETGSAWTDYGGIPGTELLLPWLLTAGVMAGRITLERLVELLCGAPARFFGVAGRKGALAEGRDADFVVVDLDREWTVRAAGLHCLNRYTPFAGELMRARVRQTWVRGRLVFDDEEGSFPAGPGWGRFVPREERDDG